MDTQKEFIASFKSDPTESNFVTLCRNSTVISKTLSALREDLRKMFIHQSIWESIETERHHMMKGKFFHVSDLIEYVSEIE
jgi:hypothetical protein